MGAGRYASGRGTFPFDAMRETDATKHAMFSYRSLQKRIPDAEPLRKLRLPIADILQSMSSTIQSAVFALERFSGVTPTVQHIEYKLF
jgi:hypothetical protein